MRFEIDDYEYDLGLVRRRSAVANDLVVLGFVEFKYATMSKWPGFSRRIRLTRAMKSLRLSGRFKSWW